MGTFNNSARRVRDSRRPRHERFRALLWAIESYAFLTRQRFHAVYDRLGTSLGFDWKNRPTAEQLLDAINEVERERNVYLAAAQVFARRRVREKAHGRRQLTKADRERWGWRPLPPPPIRATPPYS